MYNERVHLNITGREATGLPVRTIRSAQAVGGGKARRRLLLFLTVLVLLTGVCFWYVESPITAPIRRPSRPFLTI